MGQFVRAVKVTGRPFVQGMGAYGDGKVMKMLE